MYDITVISSYYDSGWQGGAREGTKIGWLLFCDTWSQLIYALSYIMERVGGWGRGKR